jgi:hypothetical protein
LTRNISPPVPTSAIPTEACSKVARKRFSLAFSSCSVLVREVMSVEMPQVA